MSKSFQCKQERGGGVKHNESGISQFINVFLVDFEKLIVNYFNFFRRVDRTRDAEHPDKRLGGDQPPVPGGCDDLPS